MSPPIGNSVLCWHTNRGLGYGSRASARGPSLQRGESTVTLNHIAHLQWSKSAGQEQSESPVYFLRRVSLIERYGVGRDQLSAAKPTLPMVLAAEVGDLSSILREHAIRQHGHVLDEYAPAGTLVRLWPSRIKTPQIFRGSGASP